MAVDVSVSGGSSNGVSVGTPPNVSDGDKGDITVSNSGETWRLNDGVGGTMTDAEVKTAYENNADTNAFTDADHTKLDGIESGADVTDADNVGSSIHEATAKTTPVDADTFGGINSAASNVLTKWTWANIKASLKTYFDSLTTTLTNKTLTTPVIDEIHDSNGNEVVIFSGVASAVNEWTATNAATGNAPSWAVTGGDTNIDGTIDAKGSGDLILQNTATGPVLVNTNSATGGELEILGAIRTTSEGSGDPQFTIFTSGSQRWNFAASNSSGNFYFQDNNNNKFPMQIAPNSENHTLRLQTNRNITIGSNSVPASLVGGICMLEGTAPSADVSNQISLWAEDVSSVAELRVRDDAGNVTTLSSHHMGAFTLRSDDLSPFSHRSHNVNTGKEGVYYLSAAVMALQEILEALATGADKTVFEAIRAKCENFIIINDVPEEDRAENDKTAEIAHQEAHIEQALMERVEVPDTEALELVPVQEMETVEVDVPEGDAKNPDGSLKPGIRQKGKAFKAEEIKTELVPAGFEVSPKTGKVQPRQVRVPKLRVSAKKEWQCRDGYEFEKETGKFYRPKTRDEALAEAPAYKPKPLQKWVQDRLPEKKTRRRKR